MINLCTGEGSWIGTLLAYRGLLELVVVQLSWLSGRAWAAQAGSVLGSIFHLITSSARQDARSTSSQLLLVLMAQ